MKQIGLYLYMGLILLLLAITVYMYCSADANFSTNYNLSSFIILLLIAIITIVGVFFGYKKPLLISSTLVIFLMSLFAFKFLFVGSLEKFLFIKNKVLYTQTAKIIINKNLKGYIDLEGVSKKLSRDFTNVYRKGNRVEIYFGIFSSFFSRGQIVYTNNMEMMLKDNSMGYTKREVIDKNWCIFYY